MVNDELFMELSAYADGELGAERTRALEEKLRADPALRRELEQFQKMDLSAAMIPVPDVEAKLNAMAGSLRPQEMKSASDSRLNAAAKHAPTVSAERFDAVWKKIAAQTVSPSVTDRDAMIRSAQADGEFDAPTAAPPSAEFEREAKLWRKLDAAAAELSVPEMSDLESREAWHAIAEQTTALTPAQRRAIEKIERATAELAVPTPSAEKYTALWSRIAERLSQTPFALRKEIAVQGTPVVSEERWNAMWKRIATRMDQQERKSAQMPSVKIPPRTSNLCLPAVGEPAPVPAPIELPAKAPVQVDFKAPRKRPWGWLAMASAAAIVILSASLFIPFDGGSGNVAVVPALEIPEALDDRYDVQVQYLQGQKEPVVCFFLKSDDAKENEVKVKDWQWLPD
jgi:anti-sigma factor RsiW